jgi:hypothetical protein
MLKPAPHDLGQGDLVLLGQSLGVTIEVIWKLNLGPDHEPNLHLHRIYGKAARLHSPTESVSAAGLAYRQLGLEDHPPVLVRLRRP